MSNKSKDNKQEGEGQDPLFTEDDFTAASNEPGPAGLPEVNEPKTIEPGEPLPYKEVVTEGPVTVIALKGQQHLIEGEEYKVTAEVANILLHQKAVKLKK